MPEHRFGEIQNTILNSKRGFYGVNTALYAYRLTVVKPGEKTESILEKAPNSTPFDLF